MGRRPFSTIEEVQRNRDWKPAEVAPFRSFWYKNCWRDTIYRNTCSWRISRNDSSGSTSSRNNSPSWKKKSPDSSYRSKQTTPAESTSSMLKELKRLPIQQEQVQKKQINSDTTTWTIKQSKSKLLSRVYLAPAARLRGDLAVAKLKRRTKNELRLVVPSCHYGANC